MPFIPHNEDEVLEMLSDIGVADINLLFDEIPDSLKTDGINIPAGLSEMAVTRLIRERIACDKPLLNFAGGGAYEHHIPSAVWQIVTRGEFYSAYTPYQAEASQGTLQVIYEYQSLVCELLAMDCANASMYDGATAAAEAVLMAIRSKAKSPRKVLVPKTLAPRIREVLKTILSLQNVEICEIEYDRQSGKTLIAELENNPACAVIIPQPNFLGVLEDVDELTDCAHKNNIAVIAYVNPLAMSLLKPPGQWGNKTEKLGADIAVGEGQPLGIPLSSGGPYFGIMTCKQELVRNMPGRIIGKTIDKQGRDAYVLTLQAREQHIRRAKATSNICSNQGLMVTAATINMAILGEAGIYSQASNSNHNLQTLIELIEADSNCNKLTRIFSSPVFNEVAFKLEGISANELINKGVEKGILIGVPLTEEYPELGEGILICATETKNLADLQKLVEFFKSI